MSQLAVCTGLRYHPNQSPFAGGSGAVIGEKQGYLLAIGRTGTAGGRALTILVRFPKTPQAEKAADALYGSAARSGISRRLTVTGDSLYCRWRYLFRRPQPREVAALCEKLLSAARQAVAPFHGRCELCGRTAGVFTGLLDGKLGYACAACEFRDIQEMDSAERKLLAISTNTFKSVGLGIVVSQGLGSLWALLCYLSPNPLFVASAFLLGALTGWAVWLGNHRFGRLVRLLALLFTVTGILFGVDFLHSMRGAGGPGLALLEENWSLQEAWSAIPIIFGAAVGCALAGLLVALRILTPRFHRSVFRLVPAPSSEPEPPPAQTLADGG